VICYGSQEENIFQMQEIISKNESNIFFIKSYKGKNGKIL